MGLAIFLPRHGHNDIRMGYAFDIGILSRYVFLAFIAPDVKTKAHSMLEVRYTLLIQGHTATFFS